MKTIKTIASLVLIFTTISCFAQSNIEDLTFDKRFYETLDKWVAFPSDDSVYHYGFIYLDQEAGFTYQRGGTFRINAEGEFASDPLDTLTNIKFRLEPEWKAVGILSEQRLKQLNLPLEPEWLAIYNAGAGTVAYLKNTGFHFNHVGACQLALEPLLEAYEREPHFEGLEFELGYAYNALEEFEKASIVLEKAIAHNSDNFYFYRELGYSYKNLNLIKKAEKTYVTGMKKSNNEYEKSEMAINMAQAYFHLNDRKKFDKWAELTRKYAEKGSTFLGYIDYYEAEWEKKE